MPKSALRTLEETSRTFYLSIERLPRDLQEAVAAGYLCMRAIDEIEDHPKLEPAEKAKLLNSISLLLHAQTSVEDFDHGGLQTCWFLMRINSPKLPCASANGLATRQPSLLPAFGKLLRPWPAACANGS